MFAPRATFTLAPFLAVVLLSATHSNGQEDTLPEFGWKNSANGHLNLSQAYFDNWTKGGSNALAWETRLEGIALRKEEVWEWESKAVAGFGQSRLEGTGTRKAVDELVLETLYTRMVSEWVNPFAASRLQTQFAAGYDYDDSLDTRTRMSGPFDPTYLTQTVGLGKSWEDAYKLRLGATLKETFSAARYGYADNPDTERIETFRIEPGASLNFQVRRGVMENILLASELDFFANFRGVDAIDVRWENQITAKVNSRISANFGFDMLYDKDLSTRRQIRQSLGVGISFLSI